MDRNTKLQKCMNYFDQLARALGEDYEIIGSCNRDCSRYLVKRGTEDQISYYGKPKYSFRISDHWNWYANLRKCDDPHYIQCHSVDLPRAKRRLERGKASKPIFAYQVAMADANGTYHHIFGEKFNGIEWIWEEKSIDEVKKILETEE